MQAALNENLKRVLDAVVTSYIGRGVPVGSRFVWVNFNVGLSPASIRNLMAELEDGGFLMKPHVSAGRIPTEMGYRLYVDRVMRSRSLKRGETQAISKAMDPLLPVADVLERVSRLVESLSHQICVTLTPARALCNLRLSNHGPRSKEYLVHVYGTGNVVSEIGDMAAARSLLGILEHRQEVARILLSDERRSGTTVRIGSENRCKPMRRCSVVSSPYSVGDTGGALGVIGPLRMEYPRLMALVEYTSQELTRFLTEAGGRCRRARQR